jgi:hypothetical protein
LRPGLAVAFKEQALLQEIEDLKQMPGGET